MVTLIAVLGGINIFLVGVMVGDKACHVWFHKKFSFDKFTVDGVVYEIVKCAK